MELDQAATAARAAEASGIRHVIWSTLEDIRPHFTHLGKDLPTLLYPYKVPHVDAKGEANLFFSSACSTRACVHWPTGCLNTKMI